MAAMIEQRQYRLRRATTPGVEYTTGFQTNGKPRGSSA
jgi:hypothetical protein